MSATTRMTALSVVMFAALSVPGCARAPPEQKLREALASLQAAVEARDASALEATLTSDFIGPDGLDRDGARRLVQLTFLRHRDIGASLGPPQIRIQPQHATVGFTALLTGGAGGLLPDAANAYEVQTAWRMKGNEWRLINAQWTPRI